MPRRRFAPIVVVAVTLGGCHSCRGARNTCEPGSVSPHAPSITDSTISVLEPQGAACRWLRIDTASGTTTVVATIPGNCDGARVAWSPDGSRGVIRSVDPKNWSEALSRMTVGKTWPADNDPPPVGLWEVDLDPAQKGAAPRSIAAPLGGDLMDLGYDASCRIVALSVEKEPPSRLGGAFLALRGESVSMHDREVQHAWRLEDGWSGIESHPDPDDEWTVRDLEAWKTLSIRSGLLLSPAPSPAEETVTDVDLLAQLVVRGGGDGDGGRWVRMESVAGPVLVYRDGDWGSGGYLAGWLAFLDGAKPVHLPKLGFHGMDAIVAQIRGRFLLVSAQYTGARPRLYDIGARQLVWASDSATSGVFWPMAGDTSGVAQYTGAPRPSEADDWGSGW